MGSVAIDDGESGAAATAELLAACLAALPALVEEADWTPSSCRRHPRRPSAREQLRARWARCMRRSRRSTPRPAARRDPINDGARRGELTRKLERGAPAPPSRCFSIPNATEPADLIGAQRSAPPPAAGSEGPAAGSVGRRAPPTWPKRRA